MGAVLGILVAVVMVTALVRLIRGWRRSTSAPASPSTFGGEPPTFRIVALGGSGSGKTVFLSSMFHELDHRGPRRRYCLDTNAEHRILLSEIYGTVSDTSKPFPAGTRTGDRREFVFDCVVADDSDGARAPVLRVSYLDYAGEILERGQEGGGTALSDLVAQMQSADALLGVIDGYRVWQLLQNIPAGEIYFRNTLQPLFGFMANAACPIQFVLTKWDLVRGFGEPPDATDEDRLDRVIAALMQFDHFSSLVHDHSRHQVVRLIPVSAVGRGFAQIVDGTVNKTQGANLRPWNVDAPFSAVLPDLFKQVEATLDSAPLKALREEGRKAFRARRLDAFAAALGGPAALAAQKLLAGVYGVPFSRRVISAYMQWMAAPLEDIDNALKETDDAAKQSLAQLQRLRSLVMEDFERTVQRLEATLPQSELRGSW